LSTRVNISSRYALPRAGGVRRFETVRPRKLLKIRQLGQSPSIVSGSGQRFALRHTRLIFAGARQVSRSRGGRRRQPWVGGVSNGIIEGRRQWLYAKLD